MTTDEARTAILIMINFQESFNWSCDMVLDFAEHFPEHRQLAKELLGEECRKWGWDMCDEAAGLGDVR